MIPSRILLMLLVGACSAEAPPKAGTPQVKAKAAKPEALYPVYGIAVDKGGLLLTDPKTREAKPAAFGMRQSLLLAILARSLGPAAEGRDKACGRDFARWPSGLTLWFDAGDFTGWGLNDGTAVIGVAPGLQRAAKMADGAGCG